MDTRTVYRHAMRTYRSVRRVPPLTTGSLAAFSSATSLVRSITGRWDIPEQRFVHVIRGQRQRLVDCEWDRRPTYRLVVVHQPAVDFGAPRHTVEVITRPGRLWVLRGMTEFCRRTRSAS